MKRNLLFGLLAIMLLAACKKDNPKEPTLLGKWTLVNTVYKVYVNGSMAFSDDSPGNGTTVDFQSNGIVVAKETGGNSTSTNYTIKTGSLVEIDGDVYDIKGLTNSNVTLYRRDGSSGDYEEETINLKK